MESVACCSLLVQIRLSSLVWDSDYSISFVAMKRFLYKLHFDRKRLANYMTTSGGTITSMWIATPTYRGMQFWLRVLLGLEWVTKKH